MSHPKKLNHRLPKEIMNLALVVSKNSFQLKAEARNDK